MQTHSIKLKDQVNEILDVINKDKNFFKIGSILDQGGN